MSSGLTPKYSGRQWALFGPLRFRDQPVLIEDLDVPGEGLVERHAAFFERRIDPDEPELPGKVRADRAGELGDQVRSAALQLEANIDGGWRGDPVAHQLLPLEQILPAEIDGVVDLKRPPFPGHVVGANKLRLVAADRLGVNEREMGAIIVQVWRLIIA